MRSVVEWFSSLDTANSSGCWLAQPRDGRGYSTAPGGEYGHRYTYSLFIGPIPAGADIDHLCRVPRCVNPAHLEAVTHRENILRSPIAIAAVNSRKTECFRGHSLANPYIRKDGSRNCRECRAMRYRAKRDASSLDTRSVGLQA